MKLFVTMFYNSLRHLKYEITDYRLSSGTVYVLLCKNGKYHFVCGNIEDEFTGKLLSYDEARRTFPSDLRCWVTDQKTFFTANRHNIKDEFEAVYLRVSTFSKNKDNYDLSIFDHPKFSQVITHINAQYRKFWLQLSVRGFTRDDFMNIARFWTLIYTATTTVDKADIIKYFGSLKQFITHKGYLLVKWVKNKDPLNYCYSSEDNRDFDTQEAFQEESLTDLINTYDQLNSFLAESKTLLEEHRSGIPIELCNSYKSVKSVLHHVCDTQTILASRFYANNEVRELKKEIDTRRTNAASRNSLFARQIQEIKNNPLAYKEQLWYYVNSDDVDPEIKKVAKRIYTKLLNVSE